MPKWRNGRRAWFRTMCPQGRGGSTPPFGTIELGISFLRPPSTTDLQPNSTWFALIVLPIRIHHSRTMRNLFWAVKLFFAQVFPASALPRSFPKNGFLPPMPLTLECGLVSTAEVPGNGPVVDF